MYVTPAQHECTLTISAEAAFKALALAIRMAITRTGGDDVPSTKGVLAL
jgi:imidazoleglycerol phosphate dehydratase HisB